MRDPRSLWRGVLVLVAVTVLSAASIAVHVAFRRDLELAHSRASSGSEVVMTRCGPIEYAVAGEGTPILIVHGTGGGFDQGMRFARGLVDRGLRVISMSRFGYLRTPFPADPSPAAQGDAHACLMDALRLERVAILGASAGALSAMQFALRHPQRCAALVLLVPAVYAPPGDGGPPGVPSPIVMTGVKKLLGSDFAFWAFIRLARGTAYATLMATPPELIARASEAERKRVDEILETILPVSTRAQGLLQDAATAASPPRYELERIAAPTLVITVKDDRFGTYRAGRYTADHVPGARFVGYETGGHLWVGHHDAVLDEVARFVPR